jgi:hypothetical protein
MSFNDNAWLNHQRAQMSRAEFTNWKKQPEIAEAIYNLAKNSGRKDWLKLARNEIGVIEADQFRWREKTWAACHLEAREYFDNAEKETGHVINNDNLDRDALIILEAERRCVAKLCRPPDWDTLIDCDTCGSVFAPSIYHSCAWCEPLSKARQAQTNDHAISKACLEETMQPVEQFELRWNENNAHLANSKSLKQALDSSLDALWPTMSDD